MQTTRWCGVDGCGREHYGRGWCRMHYGRWRRHGDPTIKLRPGGQREKKLEACSIDDCEREAEARGWCMAHYTRWWKHGDPLAGGPSQRRMNGQATCIVEGCERKRGGTSSECRRHSYLRRTYGTYDPPPKKLLPDGTKRFNSSGYVLVMRRDHPMSKDEKGWVAEHRVVMADYLGRSLLPSESVHHKNGDRTDNRLENLELWVRRQPNGQRVRDLVGWARDVLATYSDDVDSGKL